MHRLDRHDGLHEHEAFISELAGVLEDDPALSGFFGLTRSNPSYPTLKMDSTGSDVKDLQRKLRDIGYSDVTTSGTFDTNTWLAVMDFQKGQGIFQSGVVDAETWIAIDKYAGSGGSGVVKGITDAASFLTAGLKAFSSGTAPTPAPAVVAAPPPSSGPPWLLIGGVIAGVVVLGGVAILVFRR